MYIVIYCEMMSFSVVVLPTTKVIILDTVLTFIWLCKLQVR